jgi:hypothetical protein
MEQAALAERHAGPPRPMPTTRRAGLPGLSKSRFTAGLQCHRLLWWTVNEPDAPELATTPGLQAIFNQGTQVGEAAREYIPGGELIDLRYWDKEGRVAATRDAIAAGKRVIYEASFLADGVFVSVDILHRAPRARGWTLSEVKSTTKVKPQHIPDVAVQAHVVRRSGLPVARAELMHLNRACHHPDLSNLFARTKVSNEVEAYLPVVPTEVRRQLTVLARPTPPRVPTGDALDERRLHRLAVFASVRPISTDPSSNRAETCSSPPRASTYRRSVLRFRSSRRSIFETVGCRMPSRPAMST